MFTQRRVRTAGGLSILLVFVLLAAPAAAETLAWTTRAGGPGDDGVGGTFSRFSGDHVAVDAAGNVYVAGAFADGAVFDLHGEGGALASAGAQDIFIAKYDRAGTLAWVRRAGGTSVDDAAAIAVDARGVSYVTGFFTDRATFGQGESRETQLEARGVQLFVAKYAADGALIWARQGRTRTRRADNAGVSIAIDAAGAAYVTGTFEGVVDLHSGRPGRVRSLVSARPEVFVAKYDATGQVEWAEQGYGLLDDYADAIATDAAGNSVITGRFRGRIAFGWPRQSVRLSNRGHEEGFIVKLAPDGRVLWALQGDEGEAYVRYTDVALDPQGVVLVAGIEDARRAASEQSGFVRKLEPDGAHVWTSYFDARPSALAVASTGGVIVGGSFAGEVVFGDELPLTIESAGGRDGFYAGYRSDGSFAWAYDFVGGPSDEAVGGLAVDADDHRYLVGGFSASVTVMRGQPRSAQVESAGMSDLFVSKVMRFPF